MIQTGWLVYDSLILYVKIKIAITRQMLTASWGEPECAYAVS